VGRNSHIAITTSLDSRIAGIADRQHGNVTREQLLDLGLSNNAIAHRLKLGRLYRVYRGVYGVGRPPKAAIDHAHAAVLACGLGAALSCYSALSLWGLTQWTWAMHVTVPGDRRAKGINVHRAKGLIGRDFRTHLGIRVTSPARTVLDCAPHLTEKRLTRAVNDGRRQVRLRPAHLADVVERFPYHPGAKRLKPFIDVKGGPTRSEWEGAFPAFCRQYGLPEPVLSTWAAGYEADALFPDERIVVELDSWDFHSDRSSFESDRDRDVDRLVAGFITVRITWERIENRSAREAARLRELLRQRRQRAA
jgi:hypothetical protein